MEKLEVFPLAARILTAGTASTMAERYWHEEIVLEEPQTLPDSGVFRGREAAARRLEERLAIGDGRVAIDAVHDAGGDLVFAEMTVTISPAGAATDMSFPWFQLATVRDGRIVHIREFTDRTDAFAAAGISD